MAEVLIIAGMAIATFSIRYIMFGLSKAITLSSSLLNALRYVPPVVLTAIVVPEVLMSEGTVQLNYMNARLIGAIAACIVGGITRSLLLTILVGMVAFFGWQGVLTLL